MISGDDEQVRRDAVRAGQVDDAPDVILPTFDAATVGKVALRLHLEARRD